ncbi:Hypothetical predicted protein [Olea europaea subsp. europaea]|uniref:Uncharacterized protein n=1 Tax=Olea europaea subsp. europaea TaxID=158383 RepID=A0A8S0RP68_OLEEU|nr:Hypothetical predicted protein [Olea europaea subsp. europaea]
MQRRMINYDGFTIVLEGRPAADYLLHLFIWLRSPLFPIFLRKKEKLMALGSRNFFP